MAASVDDVVKKALCELVARGRPIAEASRLVGLNKRTVDVLLRQDQEFRADLEEALEIMIGQVDRTVFEEAVDGSAKHAELFYKLHRPDMMMPASSKTAVQTPATQAVQMTVQIVQALVTGDAAPNFLSMLHQPQHEVIEAEVVDGDSESSS